MSDESEESEGCFVDWIGLLIGVVIFAALIALAKAGFR